MGNGYGRPFPLGSPMVANSLPQPKQTTCGLSVARVDYNALSRWILAMDTELRTRYELAEYLIEDDPPIRFEIGVAHQGLGLLLISFGVEEAVWLTAYNPKGQRRDEEANLDDQMRLLGQIEDARLNYFVGHSMDASGDWYEPSYLVLGLTEAEGMRLGRDFGQLAIIGVDAEGSTRLIDLEHESAAPAD